MPIDTTVTRPQVNPRVITDRNGTVIIACLAGLQRIVLYRSSGHGKSFDRYIAAERFGFEDYLNGPYAISFDTSGVLWLFWGWDSFFDGVPIGSWYILSKSLDSGKTFSEVVEYDIGLLLREPRMVIDSHNNIHILRDTTISFGNQAVVYTRLANGDPNVSYQTILSNPPSPYTPYESADIAVENDSLIHFAIEGQMFNDTTGYDYRVMYLRSSDFGLSFSTLFPIDTTTQQSHPRSFITHDNRLLITFTAEFGRLMALTSSDGGLQFGEPFLFGTRQLGNAGRTRFAKNPSNTDYKTSQVGDFYHIGFAKDSAHTYFLLGSLYIQFDTSFYTASDTNFFDTLCCGDIAVDSRGEKYVVLHYPSREGAPPYTYISYKDIPTGVKEIRNQNTSQFTLSAYPNPFNGYTNLSFDIHTNDIAVIEIYNVVGQLIKRIDLKNLQTGVHTISFDGANLPNGFYIALLRSHKKITTTKLLLLK